MTELYKKSNDELRKLCLDKNINFTSRDTKRQLANKIYEMSGGRYFKCQNGRKVKFVESLENPQYTNRRFRGPDWICEETNLTDRDNPMRPGCSYGLKSGMRCVPCVADVMGKKPKECRSCVSGRNIYYCK